MLLWRIDMNKKKKYVSLIFVSVTIIACIYAGYKEGKPLFQGNNESVDSEAVDAKEKESDLTLFGAWNLALNYAIKNWDKDVKTQLITSTDTKDSPCCRSGINGRRSCWNIIMNSPNKSSQYLIHIVEGAVLSAQEITQPSEYSFDKADIILDSDEMYNIAIYQDLYGASEWAWGYHYTLQYEYIGAAETPVLTLSVRGVDNSGFEKMLTIEAASGEILLASVKNDKGDWDRVSIKDASKDFPTEDELETEYGLYEKCVEYHFDPLELRKAILNGIATNHFSPYSECESITPIEEWEKAMEDYYGEGWEDFGV